MSNNNTVIAIDHGYGRVKTAHGHFRADVTACDREPIFTHNMLVYQGGYYIIGENHKPFLASKIDDPDYNILTLAAVARELKHRGVTSASVQLAMGLPLTWVGQQKQAFKEYLLQNGTVDFPYNGVEYHVSFADANVLPQGYSAIATQLHSFRGTNILCDIGNSTMNIMYINNCRPILGSVLTDIYDATKDITKAQAAAGHTTAAMTLKHYVKGRQQKLNTAKPVSSLCGLPEASAM